MSTTAPRAHGTAYTIGLVLVVLGGGCFASIGIGGKYALEGGANALTILLVRFGVASALLWLILPLTGRQMRLPRAAAIGFFLSGMGPHMATSFFFTEALHYISAGAVTLLLYVYPAIVVGLQGLSGREPFTRGRALAVLAALCGCALVVGSSLGEEGFDPRGIALGFAAAACAATYLMINTRLLGDADPLVASAHLQAGGAATLVVLSAFTGGVDFNFSTSAALGIAAPTLLVNVLGYALLLAGLRRVGPSVASVGATVEVVATVALGALLFAEPLGPSRLAGAALILAAVVLIGREGRRNARTLNPVLAEAPAPPLAVEASPERR